MGMLAGICVVFLTNCVECFGLVFVGCDVSGGVDVVVDRRARGVRASLIGWEGFTWSEDFGFAVVVWLLDGSLACSRARRESA
jgi:hypothetical protein